MENEKQIKISIVKSQRTRKISVKMQVEKNLHRY